MTNGTAWFVLGVVLAVGAVSDWKTGKIPNWLTMPAMAAGLVINSLAGRGFRTALLGMLAALGAYLVFFAVGFRGAGDGKLMGAVGAFVGWPQIVTVMLLVALLGGAGALLLSWQQGALGMVLRNTLAVMLDIICLRWDAVKQHGNFRTPGRLRMPHGPVIAAGTLAFMLFSLR